VRTEFSTLKEHNTIYKMVGPVLLKQSHEDAKMSVESRLGYIEGEIKRVEGNIKEVQEKMEGKRREIMEVQGRVGQAGGGGD
jgi:prefoldin beta subunit